MTEFALLIPTKIEGRLRKFKATIRDSIRHRLQEIAHDAADPTGNAQAALKGPPLRFYVFDGYRISYQVDPLTRSVIVVDLQVVPS